MFRSPLRQERRERLGRALLLLFALVCLTCLLHQRAVRIEIPEVGSIAPRYVIAQVDFSFPDEEATDILRREAVKDVGVIYQLDQAQLRAVERQQLQQLISDGSWRKRLPEATFEDLQQEVGQLTLLLSRTRWTDNRTLRRIAQFDKSSDWIFLPGPPETLPCSLWEGSPSLDRYLIEAYSNINWKFLEDSAVSRWVRRRVEHQVPEITTSVHAGSTLIGQGEHISPRHVAMLKAMRETMHHQNGRMDFGSLFGGFCLACLFIGLALLSIKAYFSLLVSSLRTWSLLTTVALGTIAAAKIAEHLLVRGPGPFLDLVTYPILVPFAALLISLLLNAHLAFFFATLLSLFLAVSLGSNEEHFLVVNLVSAFATILFSRGLHKRKEIFYVCFKAWLSAVLVILSFSLLEGCFWSVTTLVDLSVAGLMLIVTAVVVIAVLPLLEGLFEVLTDLSLMEFMDPQVDLLRRLNLEAPGTYQHCLVVGNLAEAAASAIGAKGLLCRVGTLYHDIGKLACPHYFTENQLGGFDIHQLLTPLESCQVIISHVSEGERLARKHKLPQAIIDIIREHHGTTIVFSFYQKLLRKVGKEYDLVDPALFRYKGPKPRSRESAIVMIADTVEAASRSLGEVDEEELTAMIDRLVQEKADDGQFDECPLTFEELGAVKRAIAKTLVVTRHVRVRYEKPLLDPTLVLESRPYPATRR